jgi:flagella basal body P-ring formation protein FlgA
MCKRLALVALFYLAAQPLLAAPVAIELRPEVVVNGARYRLGDIAVIRGADPLVRQQVAALEIGVAPRPHHSDRISQQQVGRLLEAKRPELRGRLQWSGSKATIIRAAGIALEPQRLVQIAEESLRAELGGGYEKVELEALPNVRKMTLPPGAQLRPRPLAGVVAQRTAVWVEIRVDGRAYGAVPVWFAVKAWKQVPVALTNLPAGSALRREDFALETRDVMQAAKIIDRLPIEQGIRLRIALSRGLPVTETMLERMPAISRNQQVAVRMLAGSIVIETEGLAQADGRIGDTVKVKNPGSSEIFKGEVVEPGLVLVNAR